MRRAACPECGHEAFVCDGAVAIHGPPSRPDLVCPGSGTTAPSVACDGGQGGDGGGESGDAGFP
jgi:hypothetical protein